MNSRRKIPHYVRLSVIGAILRWLGAKELSVLIVLFAILASLWVFSELASGVVEGEVAEFDHLVLLSLRNPADLNDPLGPRWVEQIGRDITALGSMVIVGLLTLAIAGYLILDDKRHAAAVIMVATLGAMGVSGLLKSVFERDRPDLVPHGTLVYTASFPSGHATLAASSYLTLGALLARIQRRKRIKAYILLVAISLTLLVGGSRIYLGVHWPTDVLAGWTLGAGWALLCWLLARWLQGRGEMEGDEV